MRHKGARTYGREEKGKKKDGGEMWEPRKKDTMQIAMETAAGLPR